MASFLQEVCRSLHLCSPCCSVRWWTCRFTMDRKTMRIKITNVCTAFPPGVSTLYQQSVKVWIILIKPLVAMWKLNIRRWHPLSTLTFPQTVLQILSLYFYRSVPQWRLAGSSESTRAAAASGEHSQSAVYQQSPWALHFTLVSATNGRRCPEADRLHLLRSPVYWTIIQRPL